MSNVKTKNIVRVVTTLSSPYEKEYYEDYLARVGPSFVVLHSGTCDWKLLTELDRDMLRVHWLRLVSVEMRVVFGCDHVTAESNKLRAFGLDSNLASQVVRHFENLLSSVGKSSVAPSSTSDDVDSSSSSTATNNTTSNVDISTRSSRSTLVLKT